DASETVREGRQTLRERLPRRAAVGRFEQSAAWAGEDTVLPWPLARLPHHRVDVNGVRRIEHDVDAAGVGILIENLLERASAVGGAEDAALLVRSVRMAQDRDEQTIGILRIDGDLRDLLAVAEAEARPRLARVGRLVDAVAGREVRTLQPFAAADINDVGVGRGHG